MKKLKLALAGVLLWSASLFAQTYLDVAPGFGTLDSAVTAHQGNVVYRLQAGGWYTLNGQIENNGFPLTIVGTTPSPGEMPAVIQAATNTDGTVLNDMFNVIGDLTVKDVYIINANSENTLGTGGVFNVSSSSPVRVVFDSLVVDPVGGNHFIVFNPTPYPKLFMTNSLVMRHGTLAGANDWCLFDLAGPVNNGYDTLYLENNTFVSTGTHIAINRNSATDSNNFVWMNHNTFAFHKFQCIDGFHMNQYYVTNNLFFDFTTQPYNLAWDAYTPDGSGDKYQANVEQDTTAADSVNGQVMSTRKLFVEYNSEYVDPRIQSYLSTWQWDHTLNDTGSVPVGDINTAYLMRLIFPPDSAKVNREASMYGSAGFPYFMDGHYMSDVDPQWTNPKMYAIQDSIVAWDLPAMELNNWGFSPAFVPAPASTGNWWWCADSAYNLGNPVVWPRFDGRYTNSEMLTGSTEGLPLGDLNWFPNAKSQWQKNQAAIMQHIENEDTNQYVLTAINQSGNQQPTQFALSQNYPNPFNPSTQISFSLPSKSQVSLKVYNVLGELVSTLYSGVQSAGLHTATFNGDRLASGVYFYRLDAGSFSSVRKMLLIK